MSVPVHLVGSIGLDSVAETFRATGGILGDVVKRVPDGEPGGRRCWISWQYPLLLANPFLVASGDGSGSAAGFRKLRLSPGVTSSELSFGELGYAREARASYQDFVRARNRGEIPARGRFQVCLPTPFAVVNAFCAPDAVPDIEPAYEDAMLREVAMMCAEIAHDDLCIQWDLAIEMVIWDGQLRHPNALAPSEEDILTRLARISSAVPEDVELGFHLCYGDWEAKHFVEPKDAERMTAFANDIAQRAPRQVAFIHMPVPIDRSDRAFFEPLRNLRLQAGTELYLGLVHGDDGREGAKRRIAAAQEFAPAFGIAAECGLSRCKTPNRVMDLLRLHAEVAHTVDPNEAGPLTPG